MLIKKPDKVLCPKDGITEADLAEHYRAVAHRMLPYRRDRPLMLERHPDGVDDQGFMQKGVPDYFLDWIHTPELPKEDGTVDYVLADDTATMLYLVDQGCTVLHRFLSKTDRPRLA